MPQQPAFLAALQPTLYPMAPYPTFPMSPQLAFPMIQPVAAHSLLHEGSSWDQ
uniref:Uncharacterized protein n=1 Tax=Arundo donax TaxID=35708 RepID=A0A0A9AF92_ARUDO